MPRADPWGLALLVLLASNHTGAFQPNFGDSITHNAITRDAALRVLLRVFQKIPSPNGNVIPSNAFQTEVLSADKLFARYYGAPTSVAPFEQAIAVVTSSNTKVDYLHITDGRYHFDSESLAEGKQLLLTTKARAIRNILQDNYNAARKNVGSLLHTLQDFYSHSNWIELGFQRPLSNLLRAGESIGRTAGPDERTCSECVTSHSCSDKILEKVLNEKILTTGYFGLRTNSRPEGKCSHGGAADRGKRANQGINKDTRQSPHGQYHNAAAELATQATLELFQEIWDTVGDDAFLRFLNVRSPTGLTFVIDTTGSMRDDIEAAKQRTINIVNDHRRGHTQPSFYILVPFNDPDFGPVFKTRDPEKFIEKLRSLQADGGGDIPEMSLSALQLALTSALPLSYIYVFTDAPAKDAHLKDPVVGLMEYTKCTVSFLLTNALTRRRRRAAEDSGNELYRELAHTSGGLAVVSQRQDIFELTSIIDDTAHPELVTVLQRESNPDFRDNVYIFPIDGTLRNVTIYISGKPASFRLTQPGDVYQLSTQFSGSLASIKRFGDLTVVYLHSPPVAGEWKLLVISGTPYSVKVTGRSVVNFLYDFVQPFQGPHPGLTLLPGRPIAGRESMMSITVPGLPHYPTLRLQEVALIDTRGEVLRRAPLGNISGDGIFLVKFPELPGLPFHVQLNGQSEMETKFRRQSPSINTVTHTTVKVSVDQSIRAGTNGNISFTISNRGHSAHYTVQLQDDHNLVQFQPQRIFLARNESMEGTAEIPVPEGTKPGTIITLTVEATSENDLAYNVQEVTIVSQVADVTPPRCTILSREGCPLVDAGGGHCGQWNWTLVAGIVEEGSEMVTLFARDGRRPLGHRQVTVTRGNVTRVNYVSSCCSPSVSLWAVDPSGNAERCSYPSQSASRASTVPLSSLSLSAVCLSMLLLHL